MGADADPLKVALFRAAQRAHANCLQKPAGRIACVGDGDAAAAALNTFERLIMMAGEYLYIDSE
jgi:hypothetical protein